MNTKSTSHVLRTVVLAAPLAAMALTVGAGTAFAESPSDQAATSASGLSHSPTPCPPPPPPPPPEPELPLAAPEPGDPVPVPVPGPHDGIDDLQQPTDPECPEEEPEECPEPADTPVAGNGSFLPPGVDPEDVPEEEIDDLAIPEAAPEECPEPGETPVPTRIDTGFAAESSEGGVDYGVLLAGSALLAATGGTLSLRRRAGTEG